MRIGFNFHTANQYISGVEYYSLGLLNALLSIDKENEYVVFCNQPKLVRQYVTDADNLSIKEVAFIKTRVQRILWEHLILPRQAENDRLDILHCPHYICPVFYSSVPLVITIHDTIAVDHPEWCKRTNAAYYRLLMQSAMKKASGIIAPSKFTTECIDRKFSRFSSKVKLVHPGVDSIFYAEENPIGQEQVRKKYNLPARYILFVGNIEPKKNIMNLLQAFDLLREQGLKHKLVIAGKRSWKSKEELKYIRGGSNSRHIIETGYVAREDLPFLYKMADVFVSVSLCEGFGFPLLEAMACAAPVAASCEGVLAEIDQRAYSVLEPYNPAQIASAIHALITDAKLRSHQVKRGLSESEKFKWTDCARKTLAFYREVVESYAGQKTYSKLFTLS